MRRYALGAPLITSATITSRAGAGATISEADCSERIVVGSVFAGVAIPRAKAHRASGRAAFERKSNNDMVMVNRRTTSGNKSVVWQCHGE